MKNRLIRTVLLLYSILLFGAPSLYFDARIPAAVDLPAHIRTISLVDRSQSSNGFINFLENGLFATIENRGTPPAWVCLAGLSGQINSSPEAEAEQTGRMIKRSGRSYKFPLPLEWGEVDQLCREYQSDALLCLEVFSLEVFDRVAEVQTGYRLYDPSSRRIVDEFQFFHTTRWNRTVTAPDGQVVRISSEEEAIYEACYRAGVNYGRRLLPPWYLMERMYYSKSRRDGNLAAGARMMEVQNWNSAIISLEKAVETGHRKTRGRAAHNLAVVFEILGEYDKAQEWAQVAWGEYENGESRMYAQVLSRRRGEIEIIQQQEMK